MVEKIFQLVSLRATKGSEAISVELRLLRRLMAPRNDTKLWLFICLSLSLTGCDKIYSFLDKKGAEEKKIIGEVDLFEKNPKIEEVQALLKLYGYSIGRIDGIIGGQTRKAIIQFQNDNKLEVTRYVDNATWERLNYFRRLGLVTQNIELNIKLIQEILNAAGFPCGKPDGNLGDKTLQSIKAFQKHFKLKADGRIGFKTLNALSKYLRVKTEQPAANETKNKLRKKILGLLQ